MIKYSLKEVLDHGHDISSDPERITCWIDLPIISSFVKIDKNEKEESTKPLDCSYRLCKQKQGKKYLYSIRKVSFDKYGNLATLSRENYSIEINENFDYEALTRMDKALRDYLSALTKPIVSLL